MAIRTPVWMPSSATAVRDAVHDREKRSTAASWRPTAASCSTTRPSSQMRRLVGLALEGAIFAGNLRPTRHDPDRTGQ